jgi:RimJ/RimL family protein N-acetyltransferase
MNDESWFLKTERLGFRVWTENDFELAWALWGDARVTRLIGGPFSAARVRERLDEEIARMRTAGVQYWPIFRLADGAHVGCCGLRPYSAEARVLELGFHLRFEHWGHGYASESAREVIRYAFGSLHCTSLFAGHHPENTDSARLLERLGFRATHDELYAPTGLMHHCYALEPPASREG